MQKNCVELRQNVKALSNNYINVIITKWKGNSYDIIVHARISMAHHFGYAVTILCAAYR